MQARVSHNNMSIDINRISYLSTRVVGYGLRVFVTNWKNQFSVVDKKAGPFDHSTRVQC